MSQPMEVYKAINSVAGEIAKEGIAKDNLNQQQRFKFRGIDDVYNSLAPIMSKNKLCILPRVLSRDCVERKSAKGGVLFSVTLDVEFDFVSAVDGSKHTAKIIAEAMDSGDKATNKAMSAALKYACLQTFFIPTVGDNDADATTHEVEPAHRSHPSSLEILGEIDKQLEMCTTFEAVGQCAYMWHKTANEQGWPRLLKEEVAKRFHEKREILKKEANALEEAFPGSNAPYRANYEDNSIGVEAAE